MDNILTNKVDKSTEEILEEIANNKANILAIESTIDSMGAPGRGAGFDISMKHDLIVCDQIRLAGNYISGMLEKDLEKLINAGITGNMLALAFKQKVAAYESKLHNEASPEYCLQYELLEMLYGAVTEGIDKGEPIELTYCKYNIQRYERVSFYDEYIFPDEDGTPDEDGVECSDDEDDEGMYDGDPEDYDDPEDEDLDEEEDEDQAVIADRS